jgi:hypothetical protein
MLKAFKLRQPYNFEHPKFLVGPWTNPKIPAAQSRHFLEEFVKKMGTLRRKYLQ